MRPTQGWGFLLRWIHSSGTSLPESRSAMTPNPTQVIVTNEDLARSSLHDFAARHRQFPEVHGVGHSAREAAGRLADLLSQSLDNAQSTWRREMILLALEDVRAFADAPGA
jgi:hypothetical protein